MLAAGAILVVPAFFVGNRLILQAASAAVLIDEKVQSGEWKTAFETQARKVPLIERFADEIDLTAAATTATTWLSNQATAVILASSLFQLIAFGLILYVLFFLLRDRDQALAEAARRWRRSTRAEMDKLLGRCGDTIHATMYGTLATSAVQGFLGGLMFWWLGLPPIPCCGAW